MRVQSRLLHVGLLFLPFQLASSASSSSWNQGELEVQVDHQKKRTLNENLLNSYNKFSVGITPRIIGGGNAVSDTEFPWIVFLGDRQAELQCGGTLISPTLVLTAAHCSEGLLHQALIGEYDLRDRIDQETIPVQRELVHPDYDREGVQFDFMLVQLEYAPVKNMQFVRINDNSNPDEVPDKLIALGWGVVDPDPDLQNPYPDILQQVVLDSISNEICKEANSKEYDYQDIITDEMLCTFTRDKDHCFGDSGGPLVSLDIDSAGSASTSTYVQYGVSSFGIECADPVFPGVAARVSSAFPWIRQWVCALDGKEAPDYFECRQDATYSPKPSPAPVIPTTSPAPTIYTIRLWIVIYLDYWPDDINWSLQDLSTQQIILAKSKDQSDSYENEIRLPVDVLPFRDFEFTITDKQGDGLLGGGSYQIVMGPTSDTSMENSKVLIQGVGQFGKKKTHVFTVPDRWPEITATDEPTTSPISSCSEKSQSCELDADCCSSRCVVKKCRPLVRNNKQKLSGNRGGAAARVRGGQR